MPASETTCSVQGKQQSKAAALLFERLCVGSRNALQMCDVAQHLPPAVTMQPTLRSSACAPGKQPLVHVSRCASSPTASEQLRQQSAMLERKAGCVRTPG